MARYLTEFIGTFFLVLTVGLTVVGGTPMAPLAIGSALMIMVYMGGHVSGGHYNPAVSIAVGAHGALSWGDVVLYVASQLLGGLLATVVVFVVTDSTFAAAPTVGMTGALLIEILFTFALVLVILNTAVSEATKGNSYYGLAIGFTIVVAAFAGGPFSGGAFNPSVGLMPALGGALLGDAAIGPVWLYLVGPVVGGLLAVPVFAMQERARG